MTGADNGGMENKYTLCGYLIQVLCRVSESCLHIMELGAGELELGL